MRTGTGEWTSDAMRGYLRARRIYRGDLFYVYLDIVAPALEREYDYITFDTVIMLVDSFMDLRDTYPYPPYAYEIKDAWDSIFRWIKDSETIQKVLALQGKGVTVSELEYIKEVRDVIPGGFAAWLESAKAMEEMG